MRNPARRNRNIGTAKQGHGQNNKLKIPAPCGNLKSFYERLLHYEKVVQTINGHDFLFIVEQTRPGSAHACSVEDISVIIEQIPADDYGELKFIVLRQPKRKEEIIAPVWGRLIYSYEFEGTHFPAIILDAIDFSKKIKWTTKLSIEAQQELNRLISDGHEIRNNGRHFTAAYTPQHIRNTQLYRTLPHEFGHYVQYLQHVERPATEEEAFEQWEQRRNDYFRIPQAEKEKFAHNYADHLKAALTEQKIIPFDPK